MPNLDSTLCVFAIVVGLLLCHLWWFWFPLPSPCANNVYDYDEPYQTRANFENIGLSSTPSTKLTMNGVYLELLDQSSFRLDGNNSTIQKKHVEKKHRKQIAVFKKREFYPHREEGDIKQHNSNKNQSLPLWLLVRMNWNLQNGNELVVFIRDATPNKRFM